MERQGDYGDKSQKFLRSFLHDLNGQTAVETGLLSIPFLLLLAGIIQCAFIMLAQQNMDAMLDRAVRSLTTGKFQAETVGMKDTATLLTSLRSAMCNGSSGKIPTVFACSEVKLNVATKGSFASSSYPSAYSTSSKSINSSFENYACPAASTITVVTAVYALPTFFSKLLPMLSTINDGSYLLRSTAVFRTEPYTTGGC